jgi:hypothetical protein
MTRSNVAVQDIRAAQTQRENGQPQSEAIAGEKRGKRGRKPAGERGNGSLRVRYFLLAKDSAGENGKLVLGEEFENEDKALVHSLVGGVPFLRVETWIATPQKKGNVMVIEKRPQS